MASPTSIENTPKLPAFDVGRYLQRIHCPMERTPSLKYLKQLHKGHLQHIPFENLDIHMRNEIMLDVQRIYKKIILRNRGGFCYELNGLFYHLLKQLGFECHLISARVYQGSDLGPDFDHAAILVYLDDQVYLADVGFGDSFLEPKLLAPNRMQMDYNRYYRIDTTIDDEYVLFGSDNSFDYEAKYLFTKDVRQFIEFIDMCHYHQTNKKSHFKKKKLITQVTPQGRITLTDDKFITTIAGKKEEQPILNQDEFLVKLDQHFGIKLIRKR